MIAWNPAFVGRYDSPWGLLQVWSWLSGVSPPVLLREVLGARLPKLTLGSQVYDFVSTEWLVVCDGTATVGVDRANLGTALKAMLAAVIEHGGQSMLGGLSGPILDVQRVRYCCRCLRTGYHSIVHQIAGLARCPIHGDRLQDRCPNCAADMPPFAVSPDATEFRCPHCGASWLDADVVRPRSDSWRVREDDMGMIIRWVVEVQAHAPSWPTRRRQLDDNWFRSSRRDDGDGVSYKEALVWAMNEIIPFPLDPALLMHRPLGLHLRSELTGSQCRRRRCTDSKTTTVTSDHVVALARRHLALNVLKLHRRCVHDAQWVLATAQIEGFGLRFDPLLCPVGYAFVWWTLKSSRWLQRLNPSSRQLSGAQVYRTWSTLLNSFYASVQIAILMRRWISRGRPQAQGILDRGVDAWTDPWLDGTFALPETSQAAWNPQHRQFLLTDAAALATSRCDYGRALRVRLGRGMTTRDQNPPTMSS